MLHIIKILTLLTLAFITAIIWTPFLSHFLYKYKLGKRIRNNGATPIFSKLHFKKQGTPTMGGVLIWGTVLALALILSYIAKIFDYDFLHLINFLSRKETFLPLGILITSALLGLFDDLLDINGFGKHKAGIRFRYKIFLYFFIALIGAWWFYFKLDWDILHIPFWGNFSIGPWYIPIFIFIIIATSFSVNEIDGLDGLAGGTLFTSFSAFMIIAFMQGKFNLAGFCAVIVGALLAFLWFNIPPARFFMGDTGSMALGTTLGVVAVLTNSVFILPIVGLPLVLVSLSYLIQVISKKFFNRKIFLSSPLHHHLEAKGWPEPKIVMRFWIISIVSAAAGLMVIMMEKVS